MILDMSGVRKKSDDILNTIIFEWKMKGIKFNKERSISMLPAAGLVAVSHKAEFDGIYSYEMMSVMGGAGGLLNAIIFSAMPLIQEVKVHDLVMINSYIKNKLSA